MVQAKAEVVDQQQSLVYIIVLGDIDFSYVICHGKIYSRYEYLIKNS